MKTRIPLTLVAWLAILLAGLLASASTTQAQRGDDLSRAPAPPPVEFRYRPHWEIVPGTSVSMVREDERPAYDMFAYGSRYYIYDNGYWYASASWSGPFGVMNALDVPSTLRAVPASAWRDFPSDWAANGTDTYDRPDDNNRSHVDVSRAPLPPRIEFRNRPQWITVGGNVSMMRRDQRPAYDLFALGSRYYIYSGNYWYDADSWNGPFVVIDDQDVPASLRQVPRVEWREYPVAWGPDNPSDNRYGRREWRYDASRAPAPPQFAFRKNPRWGTVPGMNVQFVRDRFRTNYDLFRLGATYYVEADGYWYRSDRLNGPYGAIRARMVPAVFSRIPRQYWRSYPPAWSMN